ncbi:unnamed protein product [Triticum turgidum subsp. durum]|uniref:Uncharacterized protein n=1 Tax=Triticum turgidum subsp. durum TaxID=4567 RepID=A0A9R1R1P4_TRITD|nr:unnamed protein product [Triticum turgidum subsp. durum]
MQPPRYHYATKEAVEGQSGGCCCWLGTYGSADEATCVYDVPMWRFGRLRGEMNCPEIENRGQAEFIGLKNLVIRLMEARKKKLGIHIAFGEIDEMVMARFAHENPQYKQAKKEGEGSPSRVIPIESDSEEEEGEKEKELHNFDKPTTDPFRRQFVRASGAAETAESRHNDIAHDDNVLTCSMAIRDGARTRGEIVTLEASSLLCWQRAMSFNLELIVVSPSEDRQHFGKHSGPNLANWAGPRGLVR